MKTGKEMYRVIRKTSGDLGRLSLLPINEFHEYIRSIPYVNDVQIFGTEEDELTARPAYLLDKRIFSAGLDCKKKAILMGSYLRQRRFPYRLIASSERADKSVHHVFPQGKLLGQWFNLDATYPEMRIGERKKLTHAEVLRP